MWHSRCARSKTAAQWLRVNPKNLNETFFGTP